MPYIKRFRRVVLRDDPQNAGELNYLLTCQCLRYKKTKGESYQTYNDIVGVLENIKHEFHRRLIGPYEDKKIRENGDVGGFQQQTEAAEPSTKFRSEGAEL